LRNQLKSLAIAVDFELDESAATLYLIGFKSD